MIEPNFTTPPTQEERNCQESNTDRQNPSFDFKTVAPQAPENYLSCSDQTSAQDRDYYRQGEQPECKLPFFQPIVFPFPSNVPDEYRIREIDRERYERDVEPDSLNLPSLEGRSFCYRDIAYHECARGYSNTEFVGIIQDGKAYSTNCREIKKLVAYSDSIMLGELTDGSIFHFKDDIDIEYTTIKGTMIIAPDWKTLIDDLDEKDLVEVVYSMSESNSDTVKALIDPDKSDRLRDWLNDDSAIGKVTDWIIKNREKIARSRKNLIRLLN